MIRNLDRSQSNSGTNSKTLSCHLSSTPFCMILLLLLLLHCSRKSTCIHTCSTSTSRNSCQILLTRAKKCQKGHRTGAWAAAACCGGREASARWPQRWRRPIFQQWRRLLLGSLPSIRACQTRLLDRRRVRPDTLSRLARTWRRTWSSQTEWKDRFGWLFQGLFLMVKTELTL